ncbi:MAG: c-type cytochrome [Bacteroidia bacterium]
MKKKVFIGLVVVTVFMIYSFCQIQHSPWVAPEESKSLKNPIEKSDQTTLAGKKIFEQQCWSCHGKSGNGDGPSARNLKIKPTNFSSPSFQSQTDGEIFWKISEGRGEMAAYKNSLKEENRWQIVNYLKTLK